MTLLNRMIEQLKPLGLYKLEPGTIVFSELAAEAAGLMLFQQEVDEALRENFPQTATGYGLLTKEEAFGLRNRQVESLQRRRDMLLRAMKTGDNDYHYAGMVEALQAAGILAEIEERPSEEMLVVYCTGYTGPFTNTEAIVERCAAILPAHLAIDFKFQYVSMDMFDYAAFPFDHWESFRLSWDDLERLDFFDMQLT